MPAQNNIAIQLAVLYSGLSAPSTRRPWRPQASHSRKTVAATQAQR